MLSIPFLTKSKPAKSGACEIPGDADLGDIVSDALSALGQNRPSQALSAIAPFRLGPDIPDEVRLIAGRALTALGRYPEALLIFEEYIRANPKSTIGYLAAGLAAARARQLVIAMDWFKKAAMSLDDRARELFEPFKNLDQIDAVTIEDMIVKVESNPDDRDLALALASALGLAGHFIAVERFLPILEQ